MTKKQKRVFKIINYLKKYIDTYDNQFGYLDYEDATIINDIIYGLGVAIDKNKYEFANGFDNFKNYLATNFIQQPLCGSANATPKPPEAASHSGERWCP